MPACTILATVIHSISIAILARNISRVAITVVAAVSAITAIAVVVVISVPTRIAVPSRVIILPRIPDDRRDGRRLYGSDWSED